MNIVKILIVLCMVQTSFSQAPKLSDYRWKNRIILLSDSEDDFKNAENALALISVYKKELEERDIILFLHSNGKLYNTRLKLTPMETTTSVPKNFTGFLLIGKDGGIKSQGPYPINPDEIFTIIDRMPMRRAEMKQGN